MIESCAAGLDPASLAFEVSLTRAAVPLLYRMRYEDAAQLVSELASDLANGLPPFIATEDGEQIFLASEFQALKIMADLVDAMKCYRRIKEEERCHNGHVKRAALNAWEVASAVDPAPVG